MQRTHKIRLKPNQVQLVALRKAAGTVRFVYNWGLARWNEQYEASQADPTAEKPTMYSIARDWTKLKPEWARESNNDCQTRACLNLGKAWAGFWNRKTDKPTFHKRGTKDSFYISNTKAYLENNRIHLPKIGKVRMRETLRFQGKILGYTVSRCVDAWYVSIQVEMPEPQPSTNPSRVGVDVGIKALAVASDGTTCANPKALAKCALKLTALQQALARKTKGSRNYQRTQNSLQKVYAKVTNVRNDAIHKFTTALAKNHGEAVIETLDIAQLKQDSPKHLRCLLQDTAMREVHRQLEYKMRVQKAPQFYPSSKTCSQCGHVKPNLPLSARIYRCEACKHVQDRDLNASCNLRNMGWVTPLVTTANAV